MGNKDNKDKEFSLGGSMLYSNNPNDLFVEIDRQFLADCSTKKVMVYIYLGRFRSWADNIMYLTIEHLVKYFGFKPNNDDGKINSQFRDILQEFVDTGYITTSANVKGTGDISSKDYIKPVSAKDLFSIKIVNMNLFKIVVDTDNYKGTGFVQLTMHEIDTMLQNENVNKSDLIMCYLAIKQYINQKKTDTTHKIAFPTIETICNTIDRQSKSVASLIDELVSLKLLYRKNCGSYKKTKYGNTLCKNFPIVYALEKEYLCQSDTVLSDYFKVKLEDMGLPFIEPPHKGVSKIKDVEKHKQEKLVVNEVNIPVNKALNNIVEISSKKVTKNPFLPNYIEADSNVESSNSIEDELPFDVSNMNPVIKPYKPFGGVFEDVKKQKLIKDMDDEEFIKHMNWMENQDEDVEGLFG